MSVLVDLTQKLVSLNNVCNMTLYVNSNMNLTKFEYLDYLYEIDEYQMKEDCFIIDCADADSNLIRFKIPVNLTLYNESIIVYKKPFTIEDECIPTGELTPIDDLTLVGELTSVNELTSVDVDINIID